MGFLVSELSLNLVLYPTIFRFMPTPTTYERPAYDKLFRGISRRFCNSNPSELSTYLLWELSAALNGGA